MPFQSGATPSKEIVRDALQERGFSLQIALSVRSLAERWRERAVFSEKGTERGSRVGRVGRIEAKRNCANVRNSERAHSLLRNELDLPASPRLCARKRKEFIALRIRFSRQPRNVPFRAERNDSICGRILFCFSELAGTA